MSGGMEGEVGGGGGSSGDARQKFIIINIITVTTLAFLSGPRPASSSPAFAATKSLCHLILSALCLPNGHV